MNSSRLKHFRITSASSHLGSVLAVLLIGGMSGCGERVSVTSDAPPAGAPRLADETWPAGITSAPLADRAAWRGPLFETIPESRSRIDHVNVLDKNDPRSFLYHSGTSCGGVAIGDINGDEFPDIFLAAGPGENRLFRQLGDFQFADITRSAGVGGGDAWGVGAAMVDIDNDGDLDIYICNYDAPNQLFLNDGQGTFVEKAREAGLDVRDASQMPAFSDHDRDGDLDVYILTNRYHDPAGLPGHLNDHTVVVNGQKQITGEKGKYWRYQFIPGAPRGLVPASPVDRLLNNQGDGTFVDVSRQAGIHHEGDGLSATWWDYNRDGWPDLYVGNDFYEPDYLYRNNGDGTFTNVIQDVVPHTSWFSMGADAGDLNNDGLLDFLSADMSATTHFMQKTSMGAMGKSQQFLETALPRQYMRNALYLNCDTSRFMEVAYLTGLADSNWTWSVKIADWDNDGRNDVYISNGAARNTTDSDFSFSRSDVQGKQMWSLYADEPPRNEQNLVFRNEGNLRFSERGAEWGLDHLGMSYGAAYGDLDRDGDLDLVVANLGETARLYRNHSQHGHRVLIRLVGTQSNRRGIGATVRLHSASGQQVRQLKACSGYSASDEALVHFGLGDDTFITSLVVEWPSGHVQSFGELPVDRYYTITERDQPPKALSPAATDDARGGKTWFARSDALAGYEHQERAYDDYARQPLLPHKHSQLGPGAAWGDVDGDGDEDVFLSGTARLQPGRLYINQGNGTFRWSSQERVQPFLDHGRSEGLAPLFLDADSDGDLDLFVANGSVECDPDDESLRDRLFNNDGRGQFSHAPASAVPDVRASAGAAAAADFDRDGDLDLFVGGRIVPGRYPLPAESQLLRNDGGTFTNVIGEAAAGLRFSGLVTGAVWSDANNDGWLDLVVTHEWGPVKLLLNNGGTQLVDATQQAGLSDRVGWYNGVAARDLDNDGDIDYVVTNFGLNTKYHATAEQPSLLYYGDFEGTGKFSLVEAEFEDETLFPIRGKSCSTHAMPSLAEKFTTYRDFALADLSQIYTQKCLTDAHRLAATSLESGVLINDGAAHFEFVPLPHLAQAAPGFGIVLTEVDGDGVADLYVAQNFFSPQVETGRMDGGLSLLLRGNGDGTFEPVWPAESGLIVHQDAKSLTTTDLNADGWPDFLVGINNGPPHVYIHQGGANGRVLTVRLEGRAGNAEGVGARVTLHLDDGRQQTAEVHSGGGYLSQSTRMLTFGLGTDGKPATLEVRWPDGSRSTHRELDEGRIAIRQP